MCFCGAPAAVGLLMEWERARLTWDVSSGSTCIADRRAGGCDTPAQSAGTYTGPDKNPPEVLLRTPRKANGTGCLWVFGGTQSGLAMEAPKVWAPRRCRATCVTRVPSLQTSTNAKGAQAASTKRPVAPDKSIMHFSTRGRRSGCRPWCRAKCACSAPFPSSSRRPLPPPHPPRRSGASSCLRLRQLRHRRGRPRLGAAWRPACATWAT